MAMELKLLGIPPVKYQPSRTRRSPTIEDAILAIWRREKEEIVLPRLLAWQCAVDTGDGLYHPQLTGANLRQPASLLAHDSRTAWMRCATHIAMLQDHNVYSSESYDYPVQVQDPCGAADYHRCCFLESPSRLAHVLVTVSPTSPPAQKQREAVPKTTTFVSLIAATFRLASTVLPLFLLTLKGVSLIARRASSVRKAPPKPAVNDTDRILDSFPAPLTHIPTPIAAAYTTGPLSATSPLTEDNGDVGRQHKPSNEAARLTIWTIWIH
ncbi:hypothetical protein BDZ89DRAFT_1139521 [Hymenopellis radicata]|nr:hypothetical protein BDZ89DRAFT_1139521 [Hymenopellis radicata]